MSCCQARALDRQFSEPYVRRALWRYRTRGAEKTTLLMVEALKREGVQGLTLLDIGGGIGAVQHLLLEAGLRSATSVESSSAYLAAARREASRRGLAGKVSHRQGNFLHLARQVEPADVVTLDKVICCNRDMETLVRLSAERAGRLYALVYPRDRWWMKAALAVLNALLRLRPHGFRVFVHPSRAVDGLLRQRSFHRRFHQKTLVWQVAVYARQLGALTQS